MAASRRLRPRPPRGRSFILLALALPVLGVAARVLGSSGPSLHRSAVAERALQREQEDVLRLRAQKSQATTPADALRLQRAIEARKLDTQLELLAAQADRAQRAGQLALVRTLETQRRSLAQLRAKTATDDLPTTATGTAAEEVRDGR